MNPLLFNAPTDVGMWLSFGSVHQLDHFGLVRQVLDKRQILLGMLPIDPVPVDNPSAMLTWFQHHQALHNALNGAVGLGGFDLSFVDFNDQSRASHWIQDHAIEHMRISAFLAGIQLPRIPMQPRAAFSQPLLPQPVGSQPMVQPAPALLPQPAPALQPQPQPALQPQPSPALLPQPGPAPPTGLQPGTPVLP